MEEKDTGFGFFNQLDTKQSPAEISELRAKLSCLQSLS